MSYSEDLKKQDRWAEELRRWENAHPEHQPFREDSDSQRRLNRSRRQ